MPFDNTKDMRCPCTLFLPTDTGPHTKRITELSDQFYDSGSAFPFDSYGSISRTNSVDVYQKRLSGITRDGTKFNSAHEKDTG